VTSHNLIYILQPPN